MRRAILPLLLALTLGFSSCLVVVEEVAPAEVIVYNIEEYEVNRLFRRRAFIDMTFENVGGITARTVEAEVVFYEGPYQVQTSYIDLPDLRQGEIYHFSLETRLDFNDYEDFEIFIYWN